MLSSHGGAERQEHPGEAGGSGDGCEGGLRFAAQRRPRGADRDPGEPGVPLAGPTYGPSALLEVDQGQESRHSGLSVPVPRPRTPFYLVRAIAKEVIRRLGSGVSPEELLDNSTARHPRGTNRIRITYEDTDRKKATRLVNTLAEVASERISETSVAGKNLKATVHEEARVTRPIPDPKPLRNGLLTLVAVWTLCAGGTLALVAVLRR
jgi:hypothetical protein